MNRKGKKLLEFDVKFAVVSVKLKLSELNRLDTEGFKNAQKLPFTVVLDNVRSMHNVGSVFRTADAFRCEKIVLCGITGVPPHREITKTAIGADKTVSWEYAEFTINTIKALKSNGYTIFGIEQVRNSTALQDTKWPSGKIAFVFGNEIDGISQEVIEICDACIEIPQVGTKHSLNISVAAGIVLWEYARVHLSQLA